MASLDSNQPSWAAYEPTKDCSQGFCSIYCPQWCYIVFPPPPPFSSFDEPDSSSSSSSGPTFSPLVIAIIGILASAFLLVTYYTVVSKYCGGSFFRPRRRHRRPHPNPPSPDDDVAADNDDDDVANPHHQEWHFPPTVGLDEALISKIMVCKYKRGEGLLGSTTDCSVCLGEFLDDESLRLLPKCSHAFHVQCIDTWLRSHSNCPLCRANIVVVINPAPVPSLPPPETNRWSEGVGNDETVMEIAGLEEGTSLGDDSDASSKDVLEAEEANNHDVVEIGDDNEDLQRMKRSFSLGSFYRGRVSIADILQVDLEDEDPEILVGGNRSRTFGYVRSPVPVKRSMSSGRFCLTRHGRGRNFVLPI